MEIKLLKAIIQQAIKDIENSKTADELREFSKIKAHAEMLLKRVTQN
jgi:hypothetical protein